MHAVASKVNLTVQGLGGGCNGHVTLQLLGTQSASTCQHVVTMAHAGAWCAHGLWHPS